MTRSQYLAAIRRLNLSQVAAGKLLGVSPRQAQRIATGDSPVPKPVAKLLAVIIKFEIDPQEIP